MFWVKGGEKKCSFDCLDNKEMFEFIMIILGNRVGCSWGWLEFKVICFVFVFIFFGFVCCEGFYVYVCLCFYVYNVVVVVLVFYFYSF